MWCKARTSRYPFIPLMWASRRAFGWVSSCTESQHRRLVCTCKGVLEIPMEEGWGQGFCRRRPGQLSLCLSSGKVWRGALPCMKPQDPWVRCCSSRRRTLGVEARSSKLDSLPELAQGNPRRRWGAGATVAPTY